MVKKLTDMLEKLITEHGSAAILKERIEQFRDEIKRIEKENQELKEFKEKAQKEIEELTFELNTFKRNQEEYEMRLGCISFEGDKKLYCPNCYHTKGLKHQTSWKNRRTYFCPVCKSDLPSGG